MGVYVLLLLLLQLLQPIVSEGTTNKRTVRMRSETDALSWSSSTHTCMPNRRTGNRCQRPPANHPQVKYQPPHHHHHQLSSSSRNLLVLLLVVVVVVAAGCGCGGGGHLHVSVLLLPGTRDQKPPTIIVTTTTTTTTTT